MKEDLSAMTFDDFNYGDNVPSGFEFVARDNKVWWLKAIDSIIDTKKDYCLRPRKFRSSNRKRGNDIRTLNKRGVGQNKWYMKKESKTISQNQQFIKRNSLDVSHIFSFSLRKDESQPPAKFSLTSPESKYLSSSSRMEDEMDRSSRRMGTSCWTIKSTERKQQNDSSKL